MRLTSMAAATALGLALALGAATPAFAGPAEKQANCAALGGTLSGNGTNQVCTVTTVVVAPDVASSTPTVTYSADRPVGDAVSVDTSLPVRQPDPAVTSEERNVGEPTVVRTERAGTPEVASEDRDAGDAASEHVVVAGSPTSTQRTETGTPRAVETPTVIACHRVNDERAAKPVEKCERAILTTTTTPTTIITTTTTPQERVTTTTQPRETLITTTTPYTEVFTSTQQRESCTTTTYETLIATMSTQQTERTATAVQPTTRTTTTTVTTYAFPRNADIPTPTGAPTVTASTAPGTPVVTEAVVPGTPVVTAASRPGPVESDVECAPIAPVITETDGDTRFEPATATVPAAPIVTVTSAEIEPLVVETATAGASIVATDVRGLGEMCVMNPSASGKRGNAC
ncbi:MAG: hypothetical protein ACQEWM_09790 [Actinomycetota bacterium]